MTSEFLTCCILFITVCKLNAVTDITRDSEQVMKTISAGVVRDKIRGGLLGRILVNLNGIPHEMSYINH